MTDSVWWYVLAGFLLGFILSTLWEWLYFRRRRMQIENQRIAELEATVRSLSTVSQSAEANTSSGFAAGYQSPMVFLEGEEDDVDTVEVIVPAPAEPTDYEQQRAGTQFVAAKAAPTGRTPASNGNGVVREAPSEAPKGEPAAIAVGSGETTPSTLSSAALAAGVAAAAVWTREKERTADAPSLQEQVVTEQPAAEAPGGEAPGAATAVDQMPAAETVVYGVPADQAAAEQLAQEQLPEEHIPGLVGDLSPSRQISAVSTAPGAADQTSAPAQPAAQSAEQPAAQSTPVDQRAGTLAPAAAAALVSTDAFDDRQTMQQQPEDMVGQVQGPTAPQAAATSTLEVRPVGQGTEDAAGTAAGAPASATGQPTADAATQLTTAPTTQPSAAQPVIVRTVPPPQVPGQPERQKSTEEDSGLSPAGVAVLVSALASKLAGDQQRPPESSQAPASQAEALAALPQAAAYEQQPIPENAQADMVLPAVYDVPDTQPDTQPGSSIDTRDEQQGAEDAATGVDADSSAGPTERAGSSGTLAEAQGTGAAAAAGTGSAPAEEPAGGPMAGSGINPGKTPAVPPRATPPGVAQQEQEPELPLSAILPRAVKPAPLSKSGQARRPDATPANAVAASGIEPEIEQVSNQLDDLIDSINGLLERTQPLIEQPLSQMPPADALSTAASPAAVGTYGAGDDSGTEEGTEEGAEEDADTGVTGPYSAQNLSRMEYGLVQLMQAVRRLGRDVRSAF